MIFRKKRTNLPFLTLKDDIVKEINDKFTVSEDVVPPFLCLPSFPTAYGLPSKNPIMSDISRSMYGVQ